MSPRRKKSAAEQRQLTDLEQAVMQALWKTGEATSAEVIELFRREQGDLAETTIRTVLTNLREKGYVAVRRASGRHFLFRAKISQESVARSVLSQYVQKLTHGSPKQAMAYLIQDSDISNEELDEIRALLEARQKERGKQ